MTSSDTSPGPTATFLRWTARILSLAATGVLLLFMIGEGFAFWRFTPRELALTACFPVGFMIGLALGWWREVAGGGFAICCILGFYAVHFALGGGLPRGVAFLIFSLPAFVFVLAGVVRRDRVETHTDTATC